MSVGKKIRVGESEINVISVNAEDYISLTDMVRGVENGLALIEKWLRNKNTIEFLGIWEEMCNPHFNSPEFGGIMNAAKSVNYQANIDLENIGAIPLLPGEDGLVALKTFLSKILGRKTAAAHLGDDRVIPTRGTSVVVGEAFGEGDVLDIPVDGNEWDLRTKANRLEISEKQLEGREPRSIRYVRFLCPNKPKLMAKVEFHSKSTVPGAGNVVYEVMTAVPQP